MVVRYEIKSEGSEYRVTEQAVETGGRPKIVPHTTAFGSYHGAVDYVKQFFKEGDTLVGKNLTRAQLTGLEVIAQQCPLPLKK